MTKIEFQNQYGADLKKFIDSPFGKSFLNILGSLRPGYEFPIEEHLLSENRGALRGYELCIRNIITLSMFSKPVQEPEANYGVPDKQI